MSCKFTDLHCKEVICVCDGRRLGFVCDANIDLCDGKLQAIIVPGRCRHFGVLGPRDDYVIPWRSICRIGDDIILVDCKLSDCRVPRPKPGWFG